MTQHPPLVGGAAARPGSTVMNKANAERGALT